MTTFCRPTFPAILHVVENMRESDRREVYALRWSDDSAGLAADLMAVKDFAWIIGRERPVALIGATAVRPGVWSVFMVSTDEWRQVRFSATRWARKVMMPALLAQGAHRAECLSIEGHVVAQQWLESLGARREATHPKLGRNGETYHTYAWTDPNVHPLHPQLR